MAKGQSERPVPTNITIVPKTVNTQRQDSLTPSEILHPEPPSITLTPSTILALQQQHGNNFVQRFLAEKSTEKSSSQHKKSLGINAGRVQRDVGFELESETNTVRHETEKNLAKDVISADKISAGSNLEVHADTAGGGGKHAIEFVIGHQNNQLALHNAITRAIAAANDVNQKARNHNQGKKLSRIGNIDLNDDYYFKVTNENWPSSMQSTQGVLLGQMGNYLEETIDFTTMINYNQGEGRSAVAIGANLGGNPNEQGFLSLLGTYLHALHSWAVQDSENREGPKNAVPAMSRTDFTTIVEYLIAHGSNRVALKALALNVATQLGFQAQSHVIPPGYPTPDGDTLSEDEMPTIQQWINSMFANQGKDMLSPPPGFDNLEPDYSMGAREMDNNMVLLEERSRTGFAGVTKDEWVTKADEIIESIRDRNNQAGNVGLESDIL